MGTSRTPGILGDLCRQHIRYVRNFTFAETNTLRACPYMRTTIRTALCEPLVCFRGGSDGGSLVNRISEANLDRLEADGGACIMYTPLRLGFFDGRIHSRFAELMTRLARRNGCLYRSRALGLSKGKARRRFGLAPSQRRNWRSAGCCTKCASAMRESRLPPRCRLLKILYSSPASSTVRRR